MKLALTADTGGRRTDVLVDLDDDLTVGALTAQLAAYCGSSAERLFVEQVEVPPESRVADAGLLDGMAVGLGRPLPPGPAPTIHGWQLHVVAGPDTGLVLSLPIGDHQLARGVGVSFSDPAVSQQKHAVLSVRTDGATITDLGSTNGTTVDGRRIEQDTREPVAPGSMIGLGDTLLTIRVAHAPDAATEPAEPGWLWFLRPPRLLPFHRPVTIQLPTAPAEPHRRRIPIAGIVAPLVFGLVMAMIMSPMYLVFTLASPVMMLSNFWSDRRAGAKDHQKAVAAYTEALADAQRRLDEAIAQEQVRRRDALPDAAETLVTARLPGRRLWERRRSATDTLLLRVGVADLPADVGVEAPRDAVNGRQAHQVHAVPVPVPLREVGVLGVAGDTAHAHALLRWLTLQLAAYHAPRDLALTLLTSGPSEHWSWWAWLPHTRSREVDAYVAAVGNDDETVATRASELISLVRARQAFAKEKGRVPAEHFPAHVVLVDGARALRGTLGLAQVLEEGPEVGVYAICTDTEVRLLPESCTATIVIDADEPTRYEVRRTGHEPISDVLGEGVTEAWAMAVARALAPYRDVGGDEGDVTLPDSVRLLDLLSLEPLTSDGVRARWLLDGSTTTMMLGAGLDGPFTLDLRRDGPHGLIAGTTGSGKSELLQTIIAALAVANRPEAMNFVLVDYKGGSAFKDCAFLPHTVGMVTDLDNHLVERALTSLGAEVRYRERVLAAAAVKDIEDYADLRAKDPSRLPLPRLLIVIDEFASLARELPEFVKGLVNIAQRGRSLGIHLILATQRPSGVVSAEIRANTNLRISLRVTDATDSSDVLGAADAARIPKSAPGRGYAKLGAGGLVPFQAGRVGGRRPGVVPAHLPPPFVAPLLWKNVGYVAPSAPVMTKAADDVGLTDLSELVKAVQEAAAADGSPPQRSPWLEHLPTRLLLSDLGDEPHEGWAYGLTDVPREQVRRVATFAPARDGHLLVVGSARSGRSQLLRTLAGRVAAVESARDVHLYVLDCGNGALLPLAELPHCGAVVTRTQTERATRLLTRLALEIERRQQVLAAGGYADVDEQRRSTADPLPRVLLLIDRWEGFLAALGELDSGRLTDIVLAVLREGASVGVHAIITGDRSLAAARVSSLTDNKLALKLADKNDYGLIGFNARQVPDIVPPGRGFDPGTGLETQVALLAEDESGQAQAAALARLAAEATARDRNLPPTARPFRVDVLPTKIDFERAWALLPGGHRSPFGLVGVGGDELSALGTDFSAAHAFIVAGPVRSGRSTALAVMARSLTRTGAAVVIAAPRPSPLRDLREMPGVLAVVEDPHAQPETYLDALAAAGDRPVVFVLDDGEVLRDCPAATVFGNVVKGELRPDTHLVLGGNAENLCIGFSGWQFEARKARQGVLLSPQGPSDGDLVGVRLPRDVVGQVVQPGRGLLHPGDGRIVTVTVPTL
ncbi:MAG TPA: FtsK/SpoIIIE domain-containing protein [Frankiaceae bacterium]|jgi:S-DNA-T family DNA segregation ATPase FtsK/SpoIIIE|nr:FtsK/SpoIIIE domain-containing protein [Frankiaceae bacterium]